MMRRVSRLGVPTLSGLALSLAACGEASDQAPDDAEPAAPEVATVEAPFNTSQTPATGTEQKGHELIIRKAIAILKARNLLPPKMSSENAQNRIIYGAYFADNPWAGNANTPLETVANVMSPNIPSGGLRWGVTSDSFNFDFPYGPLMPNLRIDAKADVQWLRGADNTQKASDALRLTITLTPTAHEFVDIDYSPKVYAFAQDNLYHYSYSELKDFNDPNITSDDYALRFYPFYDRHVDEGTDAAKRGIATRMRDISVIAGADFGVTKYGAILYQLARKFMWGNTSEPHISELIRVGNDVPGWHTGGIQGSGELSDMKLDFPHTYLGGMPFVCANSKSADPCASGAPTWPIWVPASSPTVAKPGRSDDAALSYLGWAAHMIQDASLPHHAANWTGKEHEAQDAFGETPDYWYPTNDVARMKRLLMDIQVLPELDALLGTVAAPKSIDTICSSVGLSDSQVVDGSLNWQAVRGVFLENAERAYYRRKEVADVYDAVPYIEDAILGTVKLLLCAPNSQGPQSEALNRYFNGTTGEHWVTTDGVTSSTQKGVVALSGEGRRYSRVSAWDYGYWKLECGLNEFVSGTSQEPHPSAPFHGLRCSSGAGSARNCEARVVSGSAGYTGTWGDWDWGYYKADCPQGKVMVGASFDTESYQPHAIYCCSK